MKMRMSNADPLKVIQSKVGGWRGEFGHAGGAVGSGKRVEASGGAVSPGKQRLRNDFKNVVAQ